MRDKIIQAVENEKIITIIRGVEPDKLISLAEAMYDGGINENNMKSYLDCGVSGFGVSSNIIDKKLIANGDFDGITTLAKKYTEVLKQ